jgi:arginase family enzyme
MKKKIEKYPAIAPDKLAKYQDLWENSTSREGVHPEVRAHLERVKTMGGGQGIEFLSNLNKDYLGAFMAPFSREIEGKDIVVIGLPLEKSAPMNASHKYGPKVLRELSKNFMGTTEPWLDGNFDIPFDFANIIDYGTIDTYGCFDLSTEAEVVRQHYQKIVRENGCSTFMWGGDHTVSIFPLEALGQLYGPLSVIHFDAHYDLVTKADFDYPYHSGNMFAKNFAAGNVDPERMIQMGIRGRMTGLVGGHGKNFGVTTHFADECRAMSAEAMAEKVIEVVGDGPTYVSFDLDALDPVYNSASSAVEPFGLDANWCWDVLRTVRASGKVNLVGADVVEYAPQNDPARTFGYIAAGISWKLLCWLAADVKRRNGGVNNPTVWEMALGNVTL